MDSGKIVRDDNPKFEECTVYETRFRCLSTGQVWRLYKTVNEWELCSENKPNSDGYIQVKITTDDGDVKTIGLHRIIYYAHNPSFDIYDGKIEIDHRDRDRLNNAIGNLRIATRSENSCNRGVRKTSRTGIKGVFPQCNTGKWGIRIQIWKDGKLAFDKFFFRGYGKVPEGDLSKYITKEMIDLRNEKLKEYHQEFACLAS